MQRSIKSQHVLWQLYNLDRDMRNAKADKRSLEQQLHKVRKAASQCLFISTCWPIYSVAKSR